MSSDAGIAAISPHPRRSYPRPGPNAEAAGDIGGRRAFVRALRLRLSDGGLASVTIAATPRPGGRDAGSGEQFAKDALALSGVFNDPWALAAAISDAMAAQSDLDAIDIDIDLDDGVRLTMIRPLA